ncbi:MAG: TolC family protein [Acidobacteria bacterium]|nr:TolC family protein [Acidobacteriota bacterium]
MNLIQRYLVLLLSLFVAMAPISWAQQAGPEGGVTPLDYTAISPGWSFRDVYKVPEPDPYDFANSPRLDELTRGGKLYLSLADAIALAIENNLDIAYARYDPLKADTDILRAQSGGQLRGVQTQISTLSTGQSATGGGGRGGDVTGIDSRAGGGGGQGATSVGDASTFFGTAIPNLDPRITGGIDWGHFSNPQTSDFVTGTNTFVSETSNSNIALRQGFLTGATGSVSWNNRRSITNSQRTNFNPNISSNIGINFTQPLIQGFGRSLNSRIIRVAKNNRDITDLAFKQQAISTVAQIQNLYWDLVTFIADVRGREEDLRRAEKLFSDNKRRVEIGTLAPIEIVRAEAEVATAEQNLTAAITAVQQQENILKNAISKNGLASPSVLEVEIVPTDRIEVPASEQIQPIQELMELALRARPEILQSRMQLANRDINLTGVRNSLLPELNLTGDVTNNGLAGQVNDLFQPLPGQPLEAPSAFFLGGLGNSLGQVFRRNFPDYQIAVQLRIPLKNRQAKADLAASLLEKRQAEIRLRQSENSIRRDVQDALIGLRQARAQYAAAQKSRVLQERTLDAEQKKFNLGASTIFEIVQAQRDLAFSRTDQIRAQNNYIKARIGLDLSTGQTLEKSNISIDEAMDGRVDKRADPLPTESQAAQMDVKRDLTR